MIFTAGRPVSFWTALVGLIAILTVPLLFVQYPPLLDFPNHMARMYVLAFGEHDPNLSRMYVRNPAIVPYMGIDLLLPGMLRVLPLELVGRLAVWMAVVLPFLGTVLYSRAYFGRFSYWQLGSALLAYHAVILLGFLNFDIGIGLALVLAALWIAARKTSFWLRVAIGFFCLSFLFVVHLVCACYYLLIVASLELADAVTASGVHNGARNRLLAAAKQIRLSFLLLLALAGETGFSSFSNQEFTFQYNNILEKLSGLLIPFQNYNLPFDSLSAVLFAGALHYAWKRGYVSISLPCRIGCAILAFVYIICPFTLIDTPFMDIRFPVMFCFLALAGSQPVAMPERFGRGLAMGLVLLLVSRTGFLTFVWADGKTDVAQLRQTIEPVMAGQSVLVVSLYPADNPAYYDHMRLSRRIAGFVPVFPHLPGLFLTEKSAFWPYLFTKPTQMTVITTPQYRTMSEGGTAPMNYRLLEDSAASSAIALKMPEFDHWQTKFDYVLILLAGGMADPAGFLPDKLALLHQTDMAALYRVRKPTESQ